MNSSLNASSLNVDPSQTPWFRSLWYRVRRINLPVSMFLDRSRDFPDVAFLSLDENALDNDYTEVGSYYLDDTVPLDQEEELEYHAWEQDLLQRNTSDTEDLLQALEQSVQWCGPCGQYKCNGLKCCTTATSEQLADLVDRLRMGEDVVVPVMTCSYAELSELLQYSADMSGSFDGSYGEAGGVEQVRGFPCLQRKVNQIGRVNGFSSGSNLSETQSQVSYMESDDSGWVNVGDA